MIWLLFTIAAVIIALLLGIAVGHYYGVLETEQRWSEAEERAEAGKAKP